MSTNYGSTIHSDLPEPVADPEAETGKYSVLDRTPPYLNIHNAPTSTKSIEIPHAKSKQPNWTCWPLLLIYGLILTLTAGIAGGFIGRSIESNRHKDEIIIGNDPCANQTSPVAASPTIPVTSSQSTPSSTSFVRTLAQPTTGCASRTTYTSFKARTKFLEWQYTTICGHGWLNDELIAMSAATPSDCVEACVMYNTHKSSSDRTCVGGGFIPEWWDQIRAMNESGGMAYNCFLKSNASGIARNDKLYEVVALCVDGSCEDVLD